jgi:8-oxo-dGTP diphosphatase
MCLCFLVRRTRTRQAQVLLGRKLRGLGAGNLVGLGGKVEEGEEPRSAAAREAEEEAGVVVATADLEQRAFITFVFPARPSWDQQATVFVTERWRGDPVATAEIVPRWYDVAAVPFDEMWADARHWLPRVLAGEQVRAHFVFRDDLTTLTSCDVRTLEGARPQQDGPGLESQDSG